MAKLPDNVFLNLGNINFMGGVRIKDKTLTQDEFYQLLFSAGNSDSPLQWDSEYSYSAKTFVTYDGNLYVSLSNNNKGNIPTNKNFWKLYYVDKNEIVNSINNVVGNINLVAGNDIDIKTAGKAITISTKSGNKTLTVEITNQDYTGEKYSYNWLDSTLTITHNLGGRVFSYLFNNNGGGVLYPTNYINDNKISIIFPEDLENKPTTGSPWHLILSGNIAGNGDGETIQYDFSNVVVDTPIMFTANGGPITFNSDQQFKINTSDILFNNNSTNTAGGLLVIDQDGKLPPLDGSQLTGIKATADVHTKAPIIGNGTEDQPININTGAGLSISNDILVLDISDYNTNNPISIKYNGNQSIKLNGLGIQVNAGEGQTLQLSSGGDVEVSGQKGITINGHSKKITLIGSDILYNGHSINTPEGLVTLNADGKIPGNLVEFTGSLTVVTGFGLIGNGSSDNPIEINSDIIALKTDIPEIPENITLQGNVFNGPNQLVQLDQDGKLPPLDGSQLTGIQSGGGIEDAPNDNKTYGRRNNKWVEINISGGEELTENQLNFINWGANLTDDQLNNLFSYINNYDYFITYLTNNFEIKEHLCHMELIENGGDVIMDTDNVDGDVDTIYRHELEGYVLDVESYITDEDVQSKRLFPDIAYDKSVGEYGKTYIYFSQTEYETIHALKDPRNRVKIHYVQFKVNK